MFNPQPLIHDLRAERERLDVAINALEKLPVRKEPRAERGRHGISLAGRARIAAAQRARWAKHRKAS